MINKNKTGRIVISIIISLLCLSVLTGIAAAVEVPDLSKTGSISVTIKNTRTGKPVPGGELSIYKVAVVKAAEGFVFEYTEDFSGSDIQITEDTVFSAELTKAYAGIAKNKTPLTTVTVGDDGVARFENLELGLYLIVQEKAANGYTVIDPFLVTVPLKDAEGKYEYDIDATPKAGTADKEPGPDEPDKPDDPKLPQTGQLWWPVPVLVFAGILLVILGIAWKRRNSEK